PAGPLQDLERMPGWMDGAGRPLQALSRLLSLDPPILVLLDSEVRIESGMTSLRGSSRSSFFAGATISFRRPHFRGSRARCNRALAYWWSMIFSENRYPLFGIMLYGLSNTITLATKALASRT